MQKADLTGVDNDTHRIDRITLGISPVVHTGAGGTCYFVAFESRRSTYIGPQAGMRSFELGKTTCLNEWQVIMRKVVGCDMTAPSFILLYNLYVPEYRRSLLEGGTFFFTVVTYNRLPILTSPEARRLLRTAWENVLERFPFAIDAVCLLPEHIHTIWTLPEGDANYSKRWGEIKRLFTKSYLDQIGPGEIRNESRMRRGEAAIWQRRFWEHTIRDEADLNRHRDYIHYNPVKHGLVARVAEWPWSSFHRYVKMGYYEREWGEAVGEEVRRMGCGE